ncbi:SRPBCC family protein [Aliiroseovarius sp. S253]|uniref:SRPBCC family protein n=1 Tax=Aliiroseovarius sp. S253 TaxID=3415133 RepID=UPI003C7A6DEE
MIQIERTRTLNANPDAVWAVLGRYMHINDFAPAVAKVDALTAGSDGVGSKRRCHFDNGGSMVEEVTDWQEGRGYSIRGSELAPMPLTSLTAEIWIEPAGNGSKVAWSTAFQVKYGPLGWLLGQVMMKPMMGKVIDANLEGLAEESGRA